MMRRAALVCAVAAVVSGAHGTAQTPARAPDYPTAPAPLTSVTFSDAFWAPRLETVRTVTLDAAFRQSALTGRIKNFEIAGGDTAGEFCSRYAFDDSDVYKIIEGASCTRSRSGPTAPSIRYVDALIAKIAKAQEPDGYLYTARTINPAKPMAMAGKERWSNLKDSHEL